MKVIEALEYLTTAALVVRLIRKVMNMKQLFKAPIGSDGLVEMDVLDDGNASIKASYKDPNSGIQVNVEIVGSPKPALEHLKQVIPGQIDDMLIDAAESYLGLK